jgi:DegV family protein with EDD domain
MVLSDKDDYTVLCLQEDLKMKWNIITDSSCDLVELEKKCEEIHYASVPFGICIGEENYTDSAELNVDAMIDSMEQTESVGRTACPSSHAWNEEFQKEGYCIAVTISSQVSGSYNSACAARDMILENNPDKKIAVINSRSVGPQIVLLVRKIVDLIVEGKDFDCVVQEADDYIRQTHIVSVHSSFENLIKSGRLSKLSGFIANKLGFWGIGVGTSEGKLSIKQKARGCQKALEAILQEMKEKEFSKRTVIISHCRNQEFAERVRDAVLEVWQNVEVKILPTRGLCSYYIEKGGLIIGY